MLLLPLVANPAAATPVLTFNFSGTFDDKGTLTASIKFSPDLGSITDWSIKTTGGGVLGGTTYNKDNSDKHGNLFFSPVAFGFDKLPARSLGALNVVNLDVNIDRPQWQVGDRIRFIGDVTERDKLPGEDEVFRQIKGCKAEPPSSATTQDGDQSCMIGEVVPEPGTIVLLSLGLGLLGMFRRKTETA